jgi:hypothetical protein
MAQAHVKSFIRTRKGKFERVSQHDRDVKNKKKLHKHLEIKMEQESVDNLVNKFVSNKENAKAIISKYKGRPASLNVMVNGQWKDTPRVFYKNGVGGKRIKTTEMVTSYSDTSNNILKIIKEQEPMVGSIVRKYAFNSELTDDLKSEAILGLLQGLNNYHAKFNPKNPPDLHNHLFTQVRGMVQAELTRQLSARIRMPQYKQVIFSKFKPLYNEHGGNFESIAKELNLKKKDVNLNLIKTEEGQEPLPIDRWTTINKDGTYNGKVLSYENKVNSLEESRKNEITVLQVRLHGIESDKEREKFNAISKRAYIDKREKLEDSLKHTQDKGTRLGIEFKIDSLRESERNFNAMVTPISEEDYAKKVKATNEKYEELLRREAEKFKDSIGKTTLQGVNSLFDEFESVLGLRYVDTGKELVNSEGDSSLMESFIPSSTTLNPEDRFIIKQGFIDSKNILLEYIDLLDNNTAKIMKMYLGLDKSNKLYPHGLWGHSMTTAKEIAENLPKNFYLPSDKDKKTYEGRLRSWKLKEPKKKTTVKMTKKELEDFKNDIKKKIKIADKQIGEALVGVTDNLKKTIIRERIRKKHGVARSDIKRMRKDVTLTDSQYKKQRKDWEASMPTLSYTKRDIISDIAKEIDYGSLALKHLVPKEEIKRLQLGFRDINTYNIQKGNIKAVVLENIEFGRRLGVNISFDMNGEDGIIMKSFNKIRSFWNKITR